MEATMNQPPSNPGEPTGDPDKKQIPSTIKSVNAAPDAHSAECQCQSKKKNWPQRIEACCAVLLVFITGFYTFYARQQKNAMLVSNQINRDTLDSVQRAFVTWAGFVTNRVAYIAPSGQERKWQFTSHFENAGNTPAINVVPYFRIEELPDEPGDDKFAVERSMLTPLTVGVMGPKGTLDSGVIAKPESFLPLPSSGGKVYTITYTNKLFFWGLVTYHDVLPGTPIHLTEFCKQLAAAYYKASDPGGTPFYTYAGCKKHNCVDQYCADYQTVIANAP